MIVKISLISKFSPVWLLMIFALLAGCSATSSADRPQPTLASPDTLPAEVQSAPVTVRQAYQFALANADVLKQIPCYCGCGAMGHTSNYSCYVAAVGSDGAIEWDTHALGCSICVDITQDAMRLLQQGKSVAEIRAYVDRVYSQYGPSNLP